MSSNNGYIPSTLGAVYAKALFQLADEAGVLDEVSDELEQIDELMAAHPELSRLLTSRMVSIRARVGVIERVFKGRISETLLGFLKVVNQKDRLTALHAIIREFARLIDERQGTTEVDAFVAERLDESAVQRVAAGIGRAISRNVVLHQYVDPDLIGGIRIRIGDRLYDGSVANQLRLMRDNLVAAGREKARAAAATWEE